MQIPVLIEPVAGNGYRASGGEPFGFTAVGSVTVLGPDVLPAGNTTGSTTVGTGVVFV